MVCRPVPLSLLLLLNSAAAAVHTNALFSNGMVLQTSADKPYTKPTTFYGYGTTSFSQFTILPYSTADPHETITLTATPGFPGAPYHTTAAADGTWSISLKPDVTGGATEALEGSFTLTLPGSSGPDIVAEDVVFGDVFLSFS